MPAAADAWLTALEKYGTMIFEQVVTPALDLAENGFPLSAYLISYLANAAETDQEGSLSIWDSTVANQQKWDKSGPERITAMESRR